MHSSEGWAIARDFFRCVLGMVEFLLLSWMKGIEEDEKWYVKAALGPSSFWCELLMARNAWAHEDVHNSVNKQWRVSLDLYQCRDAWPEACVIELLASLGRSVCGSLRDQGEQEANLSFGVVELSTDVRSICAQGSHQIVYALSVFVGPSSFGYS